MIQHIHQRRSFLLIPILAGLTACGSMYSKNSGCSGSPYEYCTAPDSHMMQGGGPMMHGPAAMAVSSLGPTQGSSVSGSVMFHQHGDQVMMHAHIVGLTPNSVHGFHIHDKGDCSSPDGSSAGGHFNPSGKHHGAQDAEHHAGDMPNLQADAQGEADVKLFLHDVQLSPGPNSIVGRSLIVHANPDDYTTQPAGNSGPRLACGVIAAH